MKSPTTLTRYGVGGPDRKVHAGRAADRHGVRAELVVDAGVVAFAEQIQVEVREHSAVAVGIVDFDAGAAGKRHLQAVVGDLVRPGQPRFEDPGRVPPRSC